jgi:hypothetical protein
MPAGVLKVGRVTVLLTGLRELVLVHDPDRLARTSHHVELVIGIDQGRSVETRGTGDMDVHLLELAVRHVHFHEVIRPVKPVNATDVELADPAALWSLHRVANA